MNKSIFKGASFPLVLFAFIGVGIAYIDIIFTTTTRWFFLVALGLILVTTGRVFGILTTRLGLPLSLYFIWSLVSSSWSLVPELSLLKGAAAVAIMLLFSAAGRFWATGWTSNAPLYYLAPVLVGALASTSSETGVGLQDSNLYMGLTSNSNNLGIIVAGGLPLAIYLTYRAFVNRSAGVLRIVSILVLIALGVLLWRSGSRSAIAASLCIVAFAVMALRPSKMIFAIVMVVALGGIASVVVPEVQEKIHDRILIKYSLEGDIFYSRREPWERSWEGAKEGGWFGLGFGVSYGDTKFSLGLTAVGYGREKGNSQLAVLEELGIVGAILYVLLVGTILTELVKAFRASQFSNLRMEIALVTGLVFGLLLQSVFEAWWTAPGSGESALFWATVGVGYGLAKRSRQLASLRKQVGPSSRPRSNVSTEPAGLFDSPRLRTRSRPH